jgi:pimeloyl-ACP methyl ester carboxylesterase
MTTYALVPGAGLGGAAWSRVTSRLRAAGHDVHPLTLTGLAERAHLATPETDLETHVQDVIAALAAYDLTDVVLAGHSYAGAVVAGVADRVPERLRRVIYVDALVPQDGRSLFDAGGPELRAAIEAAAGGGWRIPWFTDEQLDAYWGDHGLTREDREWIRAHDAGHPLATFDQALSLDEPRVPRTYLRCTRAPGAIPPGWDHQELDAGHWPMFTAPEALAAALGACLGSPAR